MPRTPASKTATYQCLNSAGLRFLTALPWVVLAVAGGKRVRGLRAAWRQVGMATTLTVVDWADFLRDPLRLDAVLQQPCIFKIDTPGEDLHVQDALVARGFDDSGLDAQAPDALAADFGRVGYPAYAFWGLRAVLAPVTQWLAQRPWVHVINTPAALLAMADKWACQQQLAQAGVPVPACLGLVLSYAHLRQLMEQQGIRRAMVKSRYGSSAAGVVAYRCTGWGLGAREQAISTAARDHSGAWYNVKQAQSYQRSEDIAPLIDGLAEQGLYAEQWIAKPRLADAHFDVRLVCWKGQPQHRVARVGRRIMTNLHLDSERHELVDLLTPLQITNLEQTAQRAATVFDGAQLIGFDLVTQASGCCVLEANGFGDQLPGLLWQGLDTWTTQIKTHL